MLHASQVAVGEDNALSIRLYGEQKGLAWYQEDPNVLEVKSQHEPVERWVRGQAYVGEASPAAARASVLPAGHPEAFLDASRNASGCPAGSTLARAAAGLASPT